MKKVLSFVIMWFAAVVFCTPLVSQSNAAGSIDDRRHIFDQEYSDTIALSPVLQNRHQSVVRSMDWSPDGSLLVSADNDGIVKLWTKDGILIHTFQAFIEPANVVRFLDDERVIVGAARQSLGSRELNFDEYASWLSTKPWFFDPPDPTLRVFRLNGDMCAEAEAFTEDINDIEVSREQQRIVTAGGGGRWWDFDLNPISELWSSAGAASVDISTDGTELALSTVNARARESNVRLISLTGGPLKILFEFFQPLTDTVVMDPRGDMLACGTLNGFFLFPWPSSWIMGPRLGPQYVVGAVSDYFLHDFAFSHDGAHLIAATDRAPTNVKVFDRYGVPQWEKELKLRRGEKYEMMEAFGYAALAPHPSEDTVAVGRNNGDIFLFPIKEAPAVLPDAWGAEFARINDIAVSTNKRSTAVATERGVYEFDMKDLSVKRLSDYPATQLGYGNKGLSFYGMLREGSNVYGVTGEEEGRESGPVFGIIDWNRRETVHKGSLLDMEGGGISLWTGSKKEQEVNADLELRSRGGSVAGIIDLPDRNYPYEAAIEAGGRRIALVYGKSYGLYNYDELSLKLAIIDTETFNLRDIDVIDAEVQSLAWSDSGRLMTADKKSVVRVYSDAEVTHTFDAGPGAVHAAWAGPSRLLILEEESRNLVLRDLQKGVEKRIALDFKQRAKGLYYEPSYNLAFIDYSEFVAIVALQNGSSAVLAFSEDDWILADSRGYFDGSLDADRLAVLLDNKQPETSQKNLETESVLMNRPDKIAEGLGIGDKQARDFFKRKFAVRLVKAGGPAETISKDLAEESFLSRMTPAERQLFSAVYRLSGRLYKRRSGIGKIPLYSLMAVDSFTEFAARSMRGLASPLKLTLSLKKKEERNAEIHLGVSEIGGPEGRIEVRVNGSLVREIERPGKQGRTVSVPLVQGTNRIEAVFRNSSAAVSDPAVLLVENTARQSADLYFVGFGVSDYRDDDLDLLYAAKDARDLAALFSRISGFEERHIRVYSDRECSSDAFKSAKSFLQRAGPEDTVVVFIAGHGVYSRELDPVYYFLPHEAELDKLSETAVGFSVIEELMHRSPALRKLILMDTCESGELDDEILYQAEISLNSAQVRARTVRGLQLVGVQKEKEQVSDSSPLMLGRTAALLRQSRFITRDIFSRSGAVVFSASQGGELSFEPAVYRREENGFFTAAMLQALSGGSTDTNLDGSISTTELRTFVRRLVSQRTDGRQNPAVDRDNLSADIRLPAGNYDFGSHSQDDLDNALRTAVLNKGTAAVEALLAAGADPNVAYRDQRTVLSVSAAEGDTETALMLLEAGADPRLFDEDRYDGFLHAVKNDHVEIARVLVEEHGMGRDDELISVGVNGVFPLYLAARYAGMEMLDLLLSSGVHLRLTERSPLCAAAERNNTAVLKRLLEAGLDPNIPEGNYFYETPLVRAVRMKKYEAITMLLKAGADPNASGEEDFPGQRLSPIEEAAGIGDARAFRMLLDAGAMVTDSCLDKAVEIGAPEIVELLLAAGVKATNGHFHTAAGLGRLETAKLLVKVGIDPGIIDPAHEANHLVTAAVRGDRELFEWLLSLGVSLNEPPHSGTRPNRPPLHNCLSVLSNTNFIGAEQALRLFISNGADVTVTDGNGRNAYEFAVWLLENNYNEEADDSFLRLLRP